MSEVTDKRAAIIGATIGLVIGAVLIVAIPMWHNYQARGCVFVECGSDQNQPNLAR